MFLIGPQYPIWIANIANKAPVIIPPLLICIVAIRPIFHRPHWAFPCQPRPTGSGELVRTSRRQGRETIDYLHWPGDDLDLRGLQSRSEEHTSELQSLRHLV